MEKILKIKNWIEKNFLYVTAIFFLLSLYSLFLSKEINLVTADLGRHLKNGELFFQNFEIPKTNLFSFTYPEKAFINHHWGSGAFFYLVSRIAGFPGLSVFFIAISLLTFFLVFRLAEKMTSFPIALPIALLATPLLAERTEVRPEIFSYFFSVIFFWILWHWKNRKISDKWLWALPILEIIWINFHIYFFIGFLILGAFWLEEIFLIRKNVWLLTKILFVTALSSLINPFGIKAVFYPLFIFGNYGYQLVENKTMWFLEDLKIQHTSFFFFKISIALFVLSFILVFIFNRKKIYFSLTIISSFLLIMALLAIRNFTIFGLFLVLFLSSNISLVKERINFSEKTFRIYAALVSLVIFIFVILANLPKISNAGEFSFGLAPKVNAAADFFKKENLQGPIFNNYDIGGYLIYNLYPQEKVFVDNRPEAYPADFFQKIYIPMQENEEEWKRQLAEFQFNVIFFHLNDYTPWGQKFMLKRIQDPEWAPVFADQFVIIFLKRNELNKNTINHFEIPKERFSIK